MRESKREGERGREGGREEREREGGRDKEEEREGERKKERVITILGGFVPVSVGFVSVFELF